MRARRRNARSVLAAAACMVVVVAVSACGARPDPDPGAIPTQEVQYDHLPGTDSLEWIRDHAQVVVVAELVRIEPEAFAAYDPESADGIESVFRGMVFRPLRWLKGSGGDQELTVLDVAAFRDRASTEIVSYVVSDAYPFTDEDVGRRFLLFLMADPPLEGTVAEGFYAINARRYGTVLLRDDGSFASHRPDDPDNPWRRFSTWQEALRDLGFSGDR